jgi:AraC-like DNA-binding protein
MIAKQFDVEVIAVQKSPCGADWRWEHQPGDSTSSSDLLCIWSVACGKGVMTHRDGVYPFQVGDCFVVRMGDYARAEPDPRQLPTIVWAFYRYRAWLPERPPEDALPRVHRRLTDPVLFNLMLERLASVLTAEGYARERAELWMTALLMALDEEDRHPPLVGAEREEYIRIQRSCAAIRANPGQASVEELAESCGYSARHFSRLFVRYIGKTPRDFVMHSRMEVAKNLLYFSDFSISQIAERLGYGDIYHFSHQFHAQAGMTPSEFRRHDPGAKRRTPPDTMDH